jgi:membrane protease YdiL (CAAX protease family)
MARRAPARPRPRSRAAPGPRRRPAPASYAVPSGALPYDYVARTRAVPANLLFLVPFVLVYEFALIGTRSPVENAAGAWVRGLWTHAGHGAFLAATLALGVVFLVAVWRRAHDAPREKGLYGGMLVEGVVYGLCLGLVAQGLSYALPMARPAGLPTATSTQPAILAGITLGLREIGLALGAGVFEELVFRGALLAGVFALLRHALGVDRWSAAIVALLLSSYVFSAYHHWGTFGEPYHPAVFAFRFHAGIVLGLLFLTRGLGIAALAHGVYDVLVTVG